MLRRKYLLLIALIVPILFVGKMAIGGMEDMEVSHMMGHMMDDEMSDQEQGQEPEKEINESCSKGPGMMMHKMPQMMPKMGKHMMKKGMPMMYPLEYMGEYLKERLELTDEQVVKFRKVYTDYRKEVLRKKADIEIAEMDLSELLKNKGSSEKAVEDSVNKLESLKSNLNMSRVKALLKTRDFLSDEQYEDLTNFILRWRRPYWRGWAWPWSSGWDAVGPEGPH